MLLLVSHLRHADFSQNHMKLYISFNYLNSLKKGVVFFAVASKLNMVYKFVFNITKYIF